MSSAMSNKMSFKIIPDLILVKSYKKNIMLRSGVSGFIVKTRNGKVVFNEMIGESDSKNYESYKIQCMFFKRVPNELNKPELDYIEFVFRITASMYYIKKASECKYLVFKFTDTHAKYEYFVNITKFRVDEASRSIYAMLTSEDDDFKQLIPICLMFEDNSPSTAIMLDVTLSNTPNMQKNAPMKEPVPVIKKSSIREVRHLPPFPTDGTIYKRQLKSDLKPRYFIKDGDKYKEIKLPDDMSAI